MSKELETILEYCGAGTAARLDKAASIIRGVKILGSESVNGRKYPAATIRAAAGKYEGVKVNVNHPSPKDLSQPRSYQDRLGTLQNVTVRTDGLYGDLHYNPKHPVAGQLEWDAEHAPQNVGLSHNIQGSTVRGRDGMLTVESIVKVTSVDLVADPATTNGLFESQQAELDWLTLEQLQAERPDLVKLAKEKALAAILESQAAEKRRLTEELREARGRSQRRQRISSFDPQCDPQTAADFVAAITGRPTFAEQEEFYEAAGLPSMNGKARKFANDIT